jgi:hypothetical protein
MGYSWCRTKVYQEQQEHHGVHNWHVVNIRGVAPSPNVCRTVEQHNSLALFDGTRHSWDIICNNPGNFACPPQFLTPRTNIKIK